MICEACGKEFFEDWRKQKKGILRFCSFSCSHVRIYSEAQRATTKEKLYREELREWRVCPLCKTSFRVRKKLRKVYCCKEHAAIDAKRGAHKRFTEHEKLTRSQYGYLCRFSFALSQYPEEFDFRLIQEWGWYSAKNRGNNLEGVSRDHMFSVNDGFTLNVSPSIMSHPANCRLLPHKENQHKNRHSVISYEELLERIEFWNKKYASST